MRKSVVIPVIIVVVIIAVVAAVLNWPRDQNGEVPTEVRLGATLPETGIFAGFGEQGYGMQKAVDDINDEGGIYLSEWDVTVPVRLIIKDNQSDFAQVGPFSTDLVVTQEVHGLLSPNAPTDLHDPTSVVANQYGVPQIICGGPFEPWYNGMRSQEDWPFTWFAGFAIGAPQPAPRNVPGYTMVDTWFMFMDEVGALNNTNKIAGVFASSDADGIGWYATFPGLMTNYGMTVVGVEDEIGLFPMDLPQDFTSTIQAWEDAGVEILWGNCPGAHFQALWSQCYEAGFRPKICLAARAALFPVDVIGWGTTPPLGWGIGTEVWWSPSYEAADGFVGIGGRTAASLAADWATETGDPLNRSIGSGYMAAQVMLDAIERAGDVDGGVINAALAETDLDTISGWVKFDSTTHFSAVPLSFGQWFYNEGNEDEPFTLYNVASALDFIPEERDPIFPIDATLYP
jgi:branched-chain amino acid transport system substrate-binding protein